MQQTAQGVARVAALVLEATLLAALFHACSGLFEDGVCTGDMDIRNTPKQLLMLRGCKVVEGYLRVVLIDKAVPTDFEVLSFPELREVTNYVLFWKVSGLLTLGQLFPNLTLIRGNVLFEDKYAFVVHEMPSLRELHLPQLQLVMRGAVRITLNPELCLAETLDWDFIAPGAGELGEHRVRNNNQQCARCPCPGGRCWGYSACRAQQPPPRGRGWGGWGGWGKGPLGGVPAGPDGAPCHQDCLIGCSGPNNFQCFACAQLALKDQCVHTCPNGTVSFLGRRCVPTEQCESLKHNGSRGGLVLNGTCIHECPPGYRQVEEKNKKKRKRLTCQACMGPCKRSCDGAHIRSPSDALHLKGCTLVNGSLEIVIPFGENVEKELEPSLGNIQTIVGSLVVTRSHSLSSLHFLRSLRAINGMDPDKRMAILINENDNLQHLFDWGEERKAFAVPADARVLFYYNPRLCPQEIERFNEVTKLTKTMSSFNGFVNPCGSRSLSSKVAVSGSESVVLSWPAWDPAKELIGYAVFVVRAAARNITEYAGSNNCQYIGAADDLDGAESTAEEVGWEVHDVRFDRAETEVRQIVPRLQPATLYAYYIKTYTTQFNVNSPIKYFRTRPDRPSPTLAASAAPGGEPGVLSVSWQPPLRLNGMLSHYVVTGELRTDDQRQLDARDYCENPATPHRATPHRAAATPGSAGHGEECCCRGCCRVPLDEEQCGRLLRPGTAPPGAAQPVQDACGRPVKSLDRCTHVLHTVVTEHLRQDGSSLLPRELPLPVGLHSLRDSQRGSQEGLWDLAEQWRRGRDKEYLWKRRFVRIVHNQTSVEAHSLAPFGLYYVSVYACGQVDEHVLGLCGAPAVTAARSLPSPEADLVPAANATLSGGALLLRWTEPIHPNAMVVAYHVRLYRPPHLARELCVSRQRHRQQRGQVVISLQEQGDQDHLQEGAGAGAGGDTVQIRAVSLAGPGPWLKVPVKRGPGPSEEPRGGLSATTLALLATVLLALLLVVLVVLQRRARRDRVQDNQRLVNSDLTDCWDLPIEQEEDNWAPARVTGVAGVRAVRFRRVDGQVSTAVRPRPTMTPLLPEDDGILCMKEPLQKWLEPLAPTLHPTNPFHPSNHHDSCPSSPGPGSSLYNPFIWYETENVAETRPQTEHINSETQLNFETHSKRSAPLPNCRAYVTGVKKSGWERNRNEFFSTEFSERGEEQSNLHNFESELQNSSSDGSFISVNLDDSTENRKC